MNNKNKYIMTAATIIVVLAVTLFYHRHTKNPEPVLPPQATVDSTIGQYEERPNAPTPEATPPKTNKPVAIKQPPSTKLVPGCSLHFSFIPSAKIIPPGAQVTYTMTVANFGTQTCHNVSFSVYYSDSEEFIEATPKPTASNYYWQLGDLASAKERTFTATTKEKSGKEQSQIESEACATADNSKDVCADALIVVKEGAAIVANNQKAPSMISSLFTGASTPTPVAFSDAIHLNKKGKEIGVWVWDDPLTMTGDYMNHIVDTAVQNGFTTLYITIDSYEDIAALPDGPDKDSKKRNYFEVLSKLITLAKSRGISIDVEGGARDWSIPSNRWKGYALISFVQEYNQTHPAAKIHGLQYDVEAYLLPSYQNNKEDTLKQFIEFIDESANRMKDVDATFSVVIPHFYDEEQGWTPAITYNGIQAHTFTHLLAVLQKKPGSSVIVMAYRNFFDGDNGTEQIASAEIKEASHGTYTTNVIVAQETGNVQPDYVTFHGLSKNDLLESLHRIDDTFETYPNFGGVAVHYLDPFLQLK